MFLLHKLSDCLRKISTSLRLISSLLYLLITVKYQSSLNFICRRTVTFPTLDWTCCCAGDSPQVRFIPVSNRVRRAPGRTSERSAGQRFPPRRQGCVEAHSLTLCLDYSTEFAVCSIFITFCVLTDFADEMLEILAFQK